MYPNFNVGGEFVSAFSFKFIFPASSWSARNGSAKNQHWNWGPQAGTCEWNSSGETFSRLCIPSIVVKQKQKSLIRWRHTFHTSHFLYAERKRRVVSPWRYKSCILQTLSILKLQQKTTYIAFHASLRHQCQRATMLTERCCINTKRIMFEDNTHFPLNTHTHTHAPTHIVRSVIRWQLRGTPSSGTLKKLPPLTANLAYIASHYLLCSKKAKIFLSATLNASRFTNA